MLFDPCITARDIIWPACTNTRDLGGLPTRDGSETRRGQLLRSDMLYRLTPVGREALITSGVRTIIDLRTPLELVVRPSPFRDSDQGQGPRYVPLSLQGNDPNIEERLRATPDRAANYALMLDACAPYVALVLRAIARHDDGPLVFHCHAGKDRTGLVAALLLALADVPDELIAQDYAYTEERAWQAYDLLRAENGGIELSAADLAAPPEAMLATLDHLRQRYGGVREYLRQAGLGESEVARLRARLRDGAGG